MKLKRKLLVFDIESTGLSTTEDRIITLFFLEITPEGGQIEHSYKFNPGIPIPEASSKVHGITDDDVKDSPLFVEKAQEIWDLIKNSDLAGFNILNFDIPLLAEEMLRVFPDFNFGDSKFIDAGNIFKIQEPRTLSAAVQFYCGKEIEGAHDAGNDVRATWDVLQGQIKRYCFKPTVNNLSNLSYYNPEKIPVGFDNRLYRDSNGIVKYNFGKRKDLPVKDYPDYYDWLSQQHWLSDYTKQLIYREIYYKERNTEEPQKSTVPEDDTLPF